MAKNAAPRFGLKAHQVFWNEQGSIVCACCHIPYPGTDTWVWERWEEITPADMVEIDRQGGRVACEGCGKEPSRIVRLTPERKELTDEQDHQEDHAGPQARRREGEHQDRRDQGPARGALRVRLPADRGRAGRHPQGGRAGEGLEVRAQPAGGRRQRRTMRRLGRS